MKFKIRKDCSDGTKLWFKQFGMGSTLKESEAHIFTKEAIQKRMVRHPYLFENDTILKLVVEKNDVAL